MALNFSIILVGLAVIGYVTLGVRKESLESPQAEGTIEELELLAEMIEPEEELSVEGDCAPEPEAPIQACKYEKSETETPKHEKSKTASKKLKCSCTHAEEAEVESYEDVVEPEVEPVLVHPQPKKPAKMPKPSSPTPAVADENLVPESELREAAPEKILKTVASKVKSAKVVDKKQKKLKQQKPVKKQKALKRAKRV